MHAVVVGSLSIAELLLDYGADPNLEDTVTRGGGRLGFKCIGMWTR